MAVFSLHCYKVRPFVAYKQKNGEIICRSFTYEEKIPSPIPNSNGNVQQVKIRYRLINALICKKQLTMSQ